MTRTIATIETSTATFTIKLDNNQLFAVLADGTREEISDGDFEATPTDKELVERVFALYNSPGFEIVDCIEYAN